MSAEDDVAALLLALHEGPSSAQTSPDQQAAPALPANLPPPTELAAPGPGPALTSSSKSGPISSTSAPGPSTESPLIFPGSFVVQAANPPQQQPTASTSTIRRATSPTSNPSARYLSPSLPSGQPVRGVYDSYYQGLGPGAGPTGGSHSATSLPSFQTLDRETQSHPQHPYGSYYAQPYYPPPPPGSQPYTSRPSSSSYAGPSSAAYLPLPPRDPNIHPLLQQQPHQTHPQLKASHPRPPNSPGQSSDIEPAEEDDHKPARLVPPLSIPTAETSSAVPPPPPAKKRKRASAAGDKAGGKKGKGKANAAATAAAAAASAGTVTPPGGAVSGSHILHPDSGIIRCICESTEDDGYTIQCDHCFAWNHIVCMDIAPSAVPDIYFCPICSPREVNVPRAKEAQRLRREVAARAAIEEAERVRLAAVGASQQQQQQQRDTKVVDALATQAAAAAAAGASNPTTTAPPAPEKPHSKHRRKSGNNAPTANKDQPQAGASGSTGNPNSTSASAATPGPVSHKRKSNALLRDILSSTSNGPPAAQNPETPRPHPTSIDVSSRNGNPLAFGVAAGGSGSHLGSPAPSRSGTDDGLDDEGRLEAWMLEYVDVKECVVRDGKVTKLLERARRRWAKEIPPPLPPSSTTKKVVTLVAQDESKPLDVAISQPAEESKPDEEASPMDVDPTSTGPPPSDLQVPESEDVQGSPLTSDATASISQAPPPPSALPSALKTAPPPSPKWKGPKATFGPLDAVVPPVFLFGPSLATLAASTSIKVLPDSSATPPQTFTASHPTISTSLLRPVYPRPSMYALFADIPIRKGDFIGEVLGEVLAGEKYRNDPINQYRSLGAPKPSVRGLSAPLDLVIDQRGFGNETRFARNGCHSNSVVRPIIFSKTASSAGLDDDAATEEPVINFGLFASREIRGREEISVPWDWDDEHIVHALAPILQAALKSNGTSSDLPSLAMRLQPKFAGVLTHLSSVFYTCACTSKKDCSLAQMARVAEGKPLLGLTEKTTGGGRGGRRQKRPDLGPFIGALRGWRDEEKLKADQVRQALDKIRLERAAAAKLRAAEALEAAALSDDVEMEDDDSIRISPEDVAMMAEDLDDEADGNLSDASTLTEPLSHFSSDPESGEEDEEDDGEEGEDEKVSTVGPSTPQRSPSLSPPPILRTPPGPSASKTKGGVRRRPNNRVESESPPSSPPPVEPPAVTPRAQAKDSDPDSPLSEPPSSPVLPRAPADEPPSASSASPLVDLFAPDEDVSALAPAPAPAPPPKEPTPPPKEPTPPPKEPTPPPRIPTPPPAKRMSLLDWAKRRKESGPPPAPAPIPVATSVAVAPPPLPVTVAEQPLPAPPVSIITPEIAVLLSNITSAPAPSHVTPTFSEPPAPDAVPSQDPSTSAAGPSLPARLSMLSSFARRPDVQTPATSPTASTTAAPRPLNPGFVPPPAPAPPILAANAGPSRAQMVLPPGLPSRPSATGSARTPSPPPFTRPSFGPPPSRDGPLDRRGSEVDRFRGVAEYGPQLPSSSAPPALPVVSSGNLLSQHATGGYEAPAPGSFPHRPFAPGGPLPGRGGFASPAQRGGRGGLPFAPPSGPRSSIAPPTGPRAFAGPFRGRGRGGGDFVPRGPRSMANGLPVPLPEEVGRGGVISDRPPPPSWMDARDDREGPGAGGPSRGGFRGRGFMPRGRGGRGGM